MNTVREIKQRLEESRYLLENNVKELEALKKQRGLAVLRRDSRHPGQLESMDVKIGILKPQIENLPYEILELEKSFEDAKKKQAKDAAFIAENMPDIKEMKRLSRLLLLQLQKSEATNLKLKALHRTCHQLERKGGIKIKRNDICGGFESLALLVVNCKSENEGAGRVHVFPPRFSRL